MILIIGGCGYVGSQLSQHLQRLGFETESVDLELFGSQPGNRKQDYRTLSPAYLDRFDRIVMLAAHSSVRMATSEPDAAFRNNIVGFGELLEKIDHQRLLYASSASVYSGVGADPVDESWSAFEVGNIYDFSKFSNDCLAKFSGKNAIGLRFGTVNGPSPNLRTDIMINKMVLTALRDKVVRIGNPEVHRPILGINDLCRAIAELLVQEQVHGVYNLASFNATVSEIGHCIADLMEVPVELVPPSATYDFSMSCNRLMRELNFDFQDTLPGLVSRLTLHYQRHGLIEQGR
jgi:nucleoside-diphosphate-sugar epimerase